MAKAKTSTKKFELYYQDNNDSMGYFSTREAAIVAARKEIAENCGYGDTGKFAIKQILESFQVKYTDLSKKYDQITTVIGTK